MLPPKEEMQRAYQSGDASYDGIFFVAVRTTGIFCRPSCPARKPLPKNVDYYATSKEAMDAGYRPCKRCKPLETEGQLPQWASDLLADVDKDPTVRIKNEDLKSRGLDPSTVSRFFNKRFGRTFHAYARARRLGKAFEAVKQGSSIDDVALGFGYESFSGFREAFTRTFGRPPGQSRNGDCIVVSWFESPVGPLVAGANNNAVCLLEFSDRQSIEEQFARLQKQFNAGIVPGMNVHLEQLKAELEGYFAGTLQNFTLPLAYPGTPFQEKVWAELQNIPYGKTISYVELASRVNLPNGQRAVGAANGQNRIAIVIPCHRVVNKHGQLGGYGGGLWRKQFLLKLETGQKQLGC